MKREIKTRLKILHLSVQTVLNRFPRNISRLTTRFFTVTVRFYFCKNFNLFIPNSLKSLFWLYFNIFSLINSFFLEIAVFLDFQKKSSYLFQVQKLFLLYVIHWDKPKEIEQIIISPLFGQLTSEKRFSERGR